MNYFLFFLFFLVFVYILSPSGRLLGVENGFCPIRDKTKSLGPSLVYKRRGMPQREFVGYSRSGKTVG